ncbi:glycosyl transferase group 1, partial [Hyaloraphidium curvatum]
MHVVLISTPVGPLGSGMGGGMELTVAALAEEFAALSWDVTVVAPHGSVPLAAPVKTIPVPGGLQIPSQTQARDTPITMPPNPVLAAMLQATRELLLGPRPPSIVINTAYDFLPLFCTPWMPLVHFVSMGSLSDGFDAALASALAARPRCAAALTRTQAETFKSLSSQIEVVGNGLDLSPYVFRPEAGDHLAWVGRISPEKALQDAIAVAELVNLPLVVYGLCQDKDYYRSCLAAHPRARVEHAGFLPVPELGRRLGSAKALLVTPKWVEAFGNVVVEALACGVPVVAYDRGGPAEIVTNQVTGFLVPADDVHAMAAAVKKIGNIDRVACRRDVKTRFTKRAFALRVLDWATRALGVVAHEPVPLLPVEA